MIKINAEKSKEQIAAEIKDIIISKLDTKISLNI